jgi:hypothetical protein
LTHTIPGDGGGWYSAVGPDEDAAVLDREAEPDGAPAAGGAAEDPDGEDPEEADDPEAERPEAPDTVTIEPILEIVDDDTPARERSPTEEYGRPAMIFFAVTAPTPGRASRSF